MNTLPAVIPLTKDVAASLKAGHGDRLRKFSFGKGEQVFVVRGPDRAEYEATVDKMNEGGKRRTEAIEEAGEECLVFPDKEIVAEIVELMPGIYLTAGNEALAISGLKDVYSEKL